MELLLEPELLVPQELEDCQVRKEKLDYLELQESKVVPDWQEHKVSKVNRVQLEPLGRWEKLGLKVCKAELVQ